MPVLALGSPHCSHKGYQLCPEVLVFILCWCHRAPQEDVLVWLSRHGTLRGKSRQYQPWSRRVSDFAFPQLPPASCSVFSWPLSLCVCLFPSLLSLPLFISLSFVLTVPPSNSPPVPPSSCSQTGCTRRSSRTRPSARRWAELSATWSPRCPHTVVPQGLPPAQTFEASVCRGRSRNGSPALCWLPGAAVNHGVVCSVSAQKVVVVAGAQALHAGGWSESVP